MPLSLPVSPIEPLILKTSKNLTLSFIKRSLAMFHPKENAGKNPYRFPLGNCSVPWYANENSAK